MTRCCGTIIIALLCASGCERPAPPAPATAPATQPASAPATRPVVDDYVSVIRAADPQVPATQPLTVPVDLHDAGHYRLPSSVHLDLRGDLWFTHPDAPPLERVLADEKIDESQTHVTPVPVKFAVWAPGEKGWFPRLVVEEVAGLAWRWGDERHSLAGDRAHRWNEAILLADGRVAVPGGRGVSIFTFSPTYNEDFREIVDSPEANPPQILLDARGLLAWSPWDGKAEGGNGALRWINGAWTQLGPSADWPQQIVHLVPLLDGSVLQLVRSPAGGITLSMATLDTAPVDEEAITTLVAQLSDNDATRRKAAHEQLTRYGTASWPVLEKLKDRQPPEAKMRIEHLLRDRIKPTLGGRKPVDETIEIAERFTTGGVLLHLPSGVDIPSADGQSQRIKPAWISIRPGRAIELLEPVLLKDAPAERRFFAFGDEWIVSDPLTGPRRLYGNHLETMLGKSEANFGYVVGQDRRGRWLFRTSANATETLLLDPTLPDPTPRLPVWRIQIANGKVGWNREGYPAVNRGGPKHSWILYEKGWRPLDEAKDELITEWTEPPPPPARPAQASTNPATAPATTLPTTKQAAPVELGEFLLLDESGRRYHEGRTMLQVVEPDGRIINWQLPDNAAGPDDAEVTLIRTSDGRLFLFNSSGRVVRIQATGERAAPYRVEAIFTDRIPTPGTVQRIWLDPAGRIILAYEQSRLAVMFPTGRIPRELMTLIPASELKDPDE